MKIIVLGGGIAGLATSAFLAKQGKHVVVIEKSNSFEDQGAGIQITPNAEKVIKQLGIYDQFKEISDQPSSINIREIDTTRTLHSVPLDQYCMSEFTGDYHHIHRQDLIKLLSVRSKELGVEIIENEKITKIEELDKEVIVSSESGNSYQADFLIAADGLNSIARKYLFPAYAPKFRNFSAWRSLIKIDKDIDKIFLEPNLFISKNLHFVTYPIRKMSYLNCVLISKDIDKKKESWTENATLSEVTALIEGANQTVKNIFLQSTNIKKWGLYDHFLPKWHSKRISLVGDAAHPMLPFMAQGGCSSLEDSFALSHLMKNSKNISDAFFRFQKIRNKRVRRIQHISSRNRFVFHQPILIRSLIFKILELFPFILLSRLKMIYNYDVVSRTKN